MYKLILIGFALSFSLFGIAQVKDITAPIIRSFDSDKSFGIQTGWEYDSDGDGTADLDSVVLTNVANSVNGWHQRVGGVFNPYDNSPKQRSI